MTDAGANENRSSVSFIQKPFTADHLVMLIRKILDNGA